MWLAKNHVTLVTKGLQVQSLVRVEKGTKAVISANFGARGERTFNKLRANFVLEID